MTQFTKGPWRSGEMQMTKKDWTALHDADCFSIIQRGPDVIAVTWDGDDTGVAEREANRNLIAAAPDMHQALEGMLYEWDKFTRYGSPMAKAANERINFARGALTKARGET